MKARNKRTGSPVLGTLEELKGRANHEHDKYRRTPDGGLEYECDGLATVFWDDQRTVTRDDKPVFVDDNGAELTADEIELYE